MVAAFSFWLTRNLAKEVVKPLAILNSKMQEILSTNSEDAELKPSEDTSKELSNLYSVFKQLISDRRFQNNRFLDKEDALAVIDLAETCQMYDKHNYKAAGVCYNNIANLQFKNNKYMLAAENY